MRTTLKFTLVIATVLLIAACKKHHVSPTSQIAQTLTKSWKVVQVTKDGIDVTQTFNQLVVTFTDKQAYTSQNAVPPIWNASGTYSIKNENDITTLVLDNYLEMYVLQATDNQLQLKFNYQAVSGRVRSVSGEFIFTFAAI